MNLHDVFLCCMGAMACRLGSMSYISPGVNATHPLDQGAKVRLGITTVIKKTCYHGNEIYIIIHLHYIL